MSKVVYIFDDLDSPDTRCLTSKRQLTDLTGMSYSTILRNISDKWYYDNERRFRIVRLNVEVDGRKNNRSMNFNN